MKKIGAGHAANKKAPAAGKFPARSGPSQSQVGAGADAPKAKGKKLPPWLKKK